MNPEEALQILDNNIALLNGTREAHDTLRQAVQTLRVFIAEHDNPKADPKK